MCAWQVSHLTIKNETIYKPLAIELNMFIFFHNWADKIPWEMLYSTKNNKRQKYNGRVIKIEIKIS